MAKALYRPLDDSLFRDEFSLTQKSRWTQIFAEVRNLFEGRDPDEHERLKKHQEDRLNVIGHEFKGYNPFDESASYRFATFKRLIENLIREASSKKKKNSSMFTGMISKKVNVEFDEKTKKYISTNSWEMEHTYPVKMISQVLIEDYDLGKWRWENGEPAAVIGEDGEVLKSAEDSRRYIEQNYPKLLMKVALSPEENAEVLKWYEAIVNDEVVIRKEPTLSQKRDGKPGTPISINWNRVKQRLDNAEHYNETGIVFHDRFMNLNGLTYQTEWIPKNYRDLMGKKPKKIKVIPDKEKEKFVEHDYWK